MNAVLTVNGTCRAAPRFFYDAHGHGSSWLSGVMLASPPSPPVLGALRARFSRDSSASVSDGGHTFARSFIRHVSDPIRYTLKPNKHTSSNTSMQQISQLLSFQRRSDRTLRLYEFTSKVAQPPHVIAMCAPSRLTDEELRKAS